MSSTIKDCTNCQRRCLVLDFKKDTNATIREVATIVKKYNTGNFAEAVIRAGLAGIGFGGAKFFFCPHCFKFFSAE